MQLMIVGEFMSLKEEAIGGPFTDGLGRMFKSYLHTVGINPRECHFTNVFPFAPQPTVSVNSLVGPKAEGIPLMKPYKRGKYVKAELRPHVEKLWDKINHHQPNLVLACGDLALWALGAGENLITNSRGRVAPGNNAISNRKILPTYSQRQLMSEFSIRPVLLKDLDKARREMEFPEIRRPQRFVHLSPSLEDMEDFLNQYILPAPSMSVDIETKDTIITCIGFAPSHERVLVVPFYCESHPSGNYWPDARTEYKAWAFVKRVLRLGKAVRGQNYQYDMQYLFREMGIKNPDFAGDTMLLHHVLQPEMRKGLGFLASIYTDETVWKAMHKHKAADKTTKREDD